MLQQRHGLLAALHSKRGDFKADCNNAAQSNRGKTHISSHILEPDISMRSVGGSITALFLTAKWWRGCGRLKAVRMPALGLMHRRRKMREIRWMKYFLSPAPIVQQGSFFKCKPSDYTSWPAAVWSKQLGKTNNLSEWNAGLDDILAIKKMCNIWGIIVILELLCREQCETIVNRSVKQQTESEMQSHVVLHACLAGGRTDGSAGEAGAAIELCHVAKAVQTHTVCESASVCAGLY